MSIIRTVHNKENPYAMINKKALWDKDLSLEAVGLWARLLSRPDDWEVNIKELCKSCACGRDKIYSLLKELQLAGYAYRFQTRDSERKNRFSKYDTYVFEEKKTKEEIKIILTETGFTDTYVSDTYNPTTTKTKSTDIYRKTTTPTSSKSEPKKQISSSSFTIYDCLKDLDIPESKKRELSKEFPEDRVVNAVEYVRVNPIKTSALRAIFWFCRNNIEPQEPDKPALQALALQHNEIYKQKQPIAYKKNLKSIPKGTMVVWEKSGFVQIAIKSPTPKEYANVEKELKAELNRAEREFYAKYPPTLT